MYVKGSGTSKGFPTLLTHIRWLERVKAFPH
uniref:Uncharacterized protein n=1 Tax=Trichinella nativa TaxID=6335 RepID=A0A0V1KJ38_9BILA